MRPQQKRSDQNMFDIDDLIFGNEGKTHSTK